MTERLTDEEQAHLNARRRETILAVRVRTSVLNGLAPSPAYLRAAECREEMAADLKSFFQQFKESVEDNLHLEIVGDLRDLLLAYGEYVIAAERHRRAGRN